MVDMYVGYALTEWVDDAANYDFLVEVTRAFTSATAPTSEAQARLGGSADVYYRRSGSG